MKKHWKYWLMGTICAMAVPVNAQMTLVKKQKPVARICVIGETEADKQAATLLQDFVGRISHANLPIVNGEKPRKGDVVIGEAHPDAGEDGFLLKTEGDKLYIRTGGDKGSIYGVVTLLEQYLGVSYFAKDV